MSSSVYLVWRYGGSQDVTQYDLLGVYASVEHANTIANFYNNTYVAEEEVKGA